MDIFGDHALHCPCHGDRAIRHNHVRDVFADSAALAHMHPEKEKAGLLPLAQTDGAVGVSVSGRRPAD
eukprot:3916601-Amphidinium_carterae.1